MLLVQHQLIEVHAEISEVLAERPQADVGVGDIVAFAELDEAAERAQAGNAALHRLAGETVENDVDAAPVIARTSPTKLVDRESSTWATSSALSMSRLACEPAVAMMRAPRACAIWIAAMPTAPAPP